MSLKKRQFVVAVHAPSAVVFKPGERVQMRTEASHIITFETQYLEGGNGILTRGELLVDIRGVENSLDEAIESFANAAIGAIPLLALSSNAAIDEPNVWLGFDNTPGITERDFFQTHIELGPAHLRTFRQINIEATRALFSALAINPEIQRLGRGANHYNIALLSWRLGHETQCLAHLWMAVEAITKVRLRAECNARGVPDGKELAAMIGIDIKELDGFIRRELILDGDKECYASAAKASNAFEHGFLGFDEIRRLSTPIRDRFANCVRNAILELSGIDEEIFRVLTSKPWNKPLGWSPVVKYVRGKLVGSGENLAATGKLYPFMRWDTEEKTVNENGKQQIKSTETFNPELAEGIGFQMESLEVVQP